MTNILAIDLGTTTGWALRDSDAVISHGYATFRPQRFEGGGMRYLRFKRWLSELKNTMQIIDILYFEEVRRHSGVDAAHVYGGLMATLTAWCEHHRIPYLGVPVGTIKKHATGRGNAGKDEVIAAMRAKGHPVSPTTTRPMPWRYWPGPLTNKEKNNETFPIHSSSTGKSGRQRRPFRRRQTFTCLPVCREGLLDVDPEPD